jgi:hypothetical protein
MDRPGRATARRYVLLRTQKLGCPFSVGGDQAAARTYVDAWIMNVDGMSGINALGIYDDELVRTDDGWRIARRKFTSVRLSVSNS